MQSALLFKAVTGLSAFAKAASSHLAADATVNFTPFHSASEPAISLADYVARLEVHTEAGPECVALAFVLIGRYSRRTNKLPSSLCMHRLFLTALRVVTKVHHDVFRSNRTFARVGGMRLEELGKLEAHFLHTLDFNVFLRQEDLDHVMRHLEVASKAQSDIARVNSIAAALQVRSPLATKKDDFDDLVEADEDAPSARCDNEQRLPWLTVTATLRAVSPCDESMQRSRRDKLTVATPSMMMGEVSDLNLSARPMNRVLDMSSSHATQSFLAATADASSVSTLLETLPTFPSFGLEITGVCHSTAGNGTAAVRALRTVVA